MTLLGHYGPDNFIGILGAPKPGLQVEVRLPGTVTKANLFTSATGLVAAANPVVADGLGNMSFYTAAASYDFTVNVGGPGEYTLPNVPVHPDPADVAAVLGQLGGLLSSGVRVLVPTGGDDAPTINAAAALGGTLLISGTHTIQTALTFNVANTRVVCLAGAKIVKHTAFTAEPAITVSAPRVTFEDLELDGQRSTAVNQTSGMTFGPAAVGCRMIRCKIHHNKSHGMSTQAGSTVSFEGCDISNNVHSAGAGYGLLAFGVIRTDAACSFNDNGYAGVYTDVETTGSHVEGEAKRNGFTGAQLGGYKSFFSVRTEDNGSVGVMGWMASECEFNAWCAEEGATVSGDGAGLQFYGGIRNKIGTAHILRGRSWGLCFSANGYNTGGFSTLTADPGSGGTTLAVGSASSFQSAGAATMHNEYVTWTGKTSTTLTGVIRGQNKSSPNAHAIGTEVKGLKSTTLTADPGISGSTFAVASTDGLPEGGVGWVGDEWFTYRGKTSTSFLNVGRGGYSQSIPGVAHAAGSVVAVFSGSMWNTVDNYANDMIDPQDTDPAIQISGGSKYNVIVNSATKGSSLAVSIGEGVWPCDNDHNEILNQYCLGHPWGIAVVSGGSHNRIRNVSALDVWDYDPGLEPALFTFNLGSTDYAAGARVENNRVDNYETRTLYSPAPLARFSQTGSAANNSAECDLTFTVPWDPASVNSMETTFVNLDGSDGIAGVAAGDLVRAEFSETYSGLYVHAHAYGPNQINVTLFNFTPGPAVNLGNGTLRLYVHKYGA